MSDIDKILQDVFGYDSFRPLQREIIESVMSQNDTVALLPTGAGKSLTYQIPVLAKDGLALVVTPLISLMYDQVSSLRQKGILAEWVNSSMHPSDIDRILDNCIYGDVKFLYVSPERIGNYIFQARFSQMKIALIAVDEAHCISQWGYDFRPSYLNIGLLREQMPDVPFLALTATATELVVDDIALKLGLKHPKVFKSSFERKNIRFVVRKAEDKMQKVLQILSNYENVSAVVYCRTRSATVELSSFLVQNGVASDFYHAGLDSKTRSLKQNEWMAGKTRIIVATSAFGMGIDKADVRIVIHYDMPDSLEEYYQQAGRAGRDGKISFAVAVYNDGDISGMRRRVLEQFPPSDTIRRVYDCLCRYFSIPLDDGEGVIKKVNLYDFSTKYHFYTSTVETSLKILQSNGYLTYYPEYERQTRIMFMIPRDDLYKFKIENDYDDILLEALLRNYTGLFSQYTPVSEEFLSRKTGIPAENIPAVFIRLSRMHIIRYIPKNSDSVVRFDVNRYPKDAVTISVETYLERKNNKSLMCEFVCDYLVQSSMCRMELLCRYFNQDGKDVSRCGHCDLCPELGTQSLKVDTDKVIISLVGSKSIKITELKDCMPSSYSMSEILLSLRSLLWKRKMYLKLDGSLRLATVGK